MNRRHKYLASDHGRAKRRALEVARRDSGRAAAARRASRIRIASYEESIFVDTPDKRLRVPARRVVVLSDIQMPFEDPGALDQALRVVESVQPDLVILNGDIVDCYAESAFLKDADLASKSIVEGHRRARLLMKRLQRIPRKIWLGGNHEDRWRRILWAQFERLGKPDAITSNLLAGDDRKIDLSDPVGSFERIFDMARYGFTYRPWGHRVYLADDNLVVTHGKYVSRHSGYSAKRTWEWLGRSCIVGHTHRLGSYLISQDGTEYGAWENGCLCGLEPEYDDAPNWQQGFSVVRIDGPEFHVIQVPIVRRNGKPVAVYHKEARA